MFMMILLIKSICFTLKFFWQLNQDNLCQHHCTTDTLILTWKVYSDLLNCRCEGNLLKTLRMLQEQTKLPVCYSSHVKQYFDWLYPCVYCGRIWFMIISFIVTQVHTFIVNQVHNIDIPLLLCPSNLYIVL